MSHFTVLNTVVEEYDPALLEKSLNKVIQSNEFEGLTLEAGKDGALILRHPELEKFRKQNLQFVLRENGRFGGQVDRYLVYEYADRVIGRINQEYVVAATRSILHRNSTIREMGRGKSRQLIVNQR